jgi:uncharacterized integral membrane protein
MARKTGAGRRPRSGFTITPRTIAAVVIAVLGVVFIFLNRDQAQVSFIFFTAETSLWIALALAALAGFATGFLAGRRRYKA